MNIKLLAVFALASFPCASAGLERSCNEVNDRLGCGVDYAQWGYFMTDPATTDCRCCCREEDGSGVHGNTCDLKWSPFNPFRETPKGCGACMGFEACTSAEENSKIGDDSCVGHQACYKMENSKIKRNSCQGFQACNNMKDSNVGERSCLDTFACNIVTDTSIGSSSCQGIDSCPRMKRSTVGNFSCQKHFSCGISEKFKDSYGINLADVCRWCENDSVVPDDACNGDKDDYTMLYEPDLIAKRRGANVPTCNYCRVSTTPLLFCFSYVLYSHH